MLFLRAPLIFAIDGVGENFSERAAANADGLSRISNEAELEVGAISFSFETHKSIEHAFLPRRERRDTDGMGVAND